MTIYFVIISWHMWQEKLFVFRIRHLPKAKVHYPTTTSPVCNHGSSTDDSRDKYGRLKTFTMCWISSAQSKKITILSWMNTWRLGWRLDEPLQFWKKNESNFPQLARLAVVCSSVPAFPVFVECLSTVSGAPQRSRQASFFPHKLEQIMAIGSVKSKKT